MDMPERGVLFVGERPALSAPVARRLKSAGWTCRYACSCEQALEALQDRRFRLVLSSAKLPDGNARRLLPLVEEASGWLFLSFPVEDGCWWIPVMEAGRTCLEAEALRSREFSKVLAKILKSAQATGPVEEARGTNGNLTEVARRAAYATGTY